MSLTLTIAWKWKMCMVYNGFVRYSFALCLLVTWNCMKLCLSDVVLCFFLSYRHLHSTFMLSSFPLIWNLKSLQWSRLAILYSKSVKITIHCILLLLLLAFFNLTFLSMKNCVLCACRNDFRMKMLTVLFIFSLRVAKQ